MFIKKEHKRFCDRALYLLAFKIFLGKKRMGRLREG